MRYPSPERVEVAPRHVLGRWLRFLPSPGLSAARRKDFSEVAAQQAKILNRIDARFKELGGWSPEVSKAVGWEDQGDA